MKMYINSVKLLLLLVLTTSSLQAQNFTSKDTVLCGAANNDVFSLDALLGDPGLDPSCTGSWSEANGNNRITFFAANNTIRIDRNNQACGTFTFAGGGTATCPAFSIDLNVEAARSVRAIVFGQERTVCLNEPPVPLEATISNAVSSLQWEQSIVSPTAGFMDIPGETDPIYDPGVLAQTTYYRIRTTADGSCPGITEDCERVSEVVTVTVDQTCTAADADCLLEVGSAMVTCNFVNDSSEFTLDLVATGINLPPGQDVSLSFNGAVLATASLGANGEVTFSQLDISKRPGFAFPVRLEVVGTPTCFVTRAIDLIACTPTCVQGADAIGGTVFEDINDDGVQDANDLVEGNVNVEIYDDNGDLVCSVFTNVNGNWSCDGLTPGANYRVEFSSPLEPYLNQSFAGANNATSVQFASPGTCGLTHGVNYSPLVCNENPDIVTSCFVGGVFDGEGRDFETILRIPFVAEGIPGDAGYIPPTALATHGETGTVWGMSHNRSENKLYFAANLRRHTGFGPLGPGGIYEYDLSTNTISPWLDLATLGLNVGTDPRDPNSAADSIPVFPENNRSRDSTAFFLTARMSFGDLEMAEDDKSFWVMNLATKEVIQVDLATQTILNRVQISNETIARPNCPEEEVIPWGLKVYRNRLYIGIVCTAQSSQDLSELDGYVVSIDINDPAAPPLVNLKIDLDYDRTTQIFGGDTDWRPWNDNVTSVVRDGQRIVLNAQPLISDIEFDGEGNMVIAVMDAFGHKIVSGQHTPYAEDEGTDWTNAGDILRACRLNGSFIVEGQGGCPQPNVGEFFEDDSHRSPPRLLETGNGGIGLLVSQNTLVSTATNPTFVWENGFTFMDTETGDKIKPYRIYATLLQGDFGLTSGKSQGLGDLEFICNLPPREVGNYVWFDDDGDGIQDPGEQPVPGLPISLYDATTGTFEAIDTTDATGNYYFTPAEPDHEYIIVYGFDANDNSSPWDNQNRTITLNGDEYTVTRSGTGEGTNPGLNDNDAVFGDAGARTNYPVVPFMLGLGTDHSYDLGLAPPVDCALTVAAETVCFFENGVNTFSLNITITTEGIPAGEDLIVSFNGDQIATVTPDPGGMTELTAVALPGAVPGYSNALTVSYSTTTDCNAAASVDLIACTPACDGSDGEVGGNAFLDNNNDGANAGAGEVGQGNVLVRIYDCADMLVCEVYTNEDGDWSCDGATALDTVRVEYSTPLQPNLEEGIAGVNNGTSTQFVIAGTCNSSYGLTTNVIPCDPQSIFTACYVAGAAQNNFGPDDAFLRFNYDASGQLGSAMNNAADKTTLATKQQIGSTWGVAMDYERDQIYASAVLKAQTGMGPEGLGAIYIIDPDGVAAPTLLIDIPNVGTIPDDASRGLRRANQKANDFEAVEKAATVGIGDIDISTDEQSLYVMNLFSREVVVVDLATSSITATIPVPDPGCNDGNYRPWSLKVVGQSLYAGVICDAVTGTRDDLSASVYRMDLTTNTFDAAPVLAFPLNHDRDEAWDTSPTISARWNQWRPDAQLSSWNNQDRLSQPTPLLSDIEFDDTGNMILGFADRSTFQLDQNSRFQTPTGTTNLRFFAGGGDIMRATVNPAGGFTIEPQQFPAVAGNNDVEPEFFDEDNFRDKHMETATGGLLIVPTTGEVLTTSYDQFGIFEQGITAFSTTDGSTNREYTVFDDDADTGGALKGTGLGDLEAFCDFYKQLQIGNYAWLDLDEDGIQDACEPPLEGVIVKLYSKPSDGGNPELLASTTTNASGNYYFAGRDLDDATWETGVTNDTLNRDSLYFVAFCGDEAFDDNINSFELNNIVYCVSPANQTGTSPDNDMVDSDITVQTINGATTPAYCLEDGELDNGTNHTFDAGFKVVCPFVSLVILSPTLCSTDTVQLSMLVDSIFAPATYNYLWDTDGDGTFFDASGIETTDYDEAVSYIPGPVDKSSGGFSLSLFDNPTLRLSGCDPAIDQLSITILNVDCGSFFWNGDR